MASTYTAFITSLQKSAETLNSFSNEFEILKHEIQQMNSIYSNPLFCILDKNKKLFDNLKCSSDTDIDVVTRVISALINLKIDQNDDLNIIRNILIIFFTIFIRAREAYVVANAQNVKNTSKNVDERSHMKLVFFFEQFYDQIKKSHLQEVNSPLLFFIGVIYASNHNIKDDLKFDLMKILSSFRVFDIVRIKWLKRSYHLFTEKTYKILNHTIYFALSTFFYVITISQNSDIFDKQNNTHALLLYIFKHQKKGDGIGSFFINNFLSNTSKIKIFSNRFDNYYIKLTSRAIKSGISASTIWDVIKVQKIDNFMNDLQDSLDELVATNDNDQNALYSIQLLYKFSKYLDISCFEEFVVRCYKPRSTGIDTELQDESEDNNFSCFITFVYFITDFLWKHKYNIYAAKILEQLTLKYPIFMADYYNSLFADRFSDIVKIIDDSSNNYRLIIAFIRSTNYFIHYHFSYQTPIKELPFLVKYFIFDFFPSAVYRKYKTKKAQWKVFTELIETAIDLILTDYPCLLLAHENEEFIASLIVLINYSAKNIYITFQEKEKTDSSDKKTSQPNNKATPPSNEDPDDNLDDDSEIQPLNYRDADFQLDFEIKSLRLLHHLLSIHIIKDDKPTLLYTELFNDQWISKLIASLTNFLRLKSSPPIYAEICPKINQLRSLSFDLFELLCNACSKNKDGDNSFEVYYPTAFQDIYNNINYGSLYSPQSFDEMIRVIDFASSVLETQKTFAYSLIRQHYFGIIAEAIIKFDPTSITLECDWALLASISKLVSKLFIELNTRTQIVQLLLYPERIPKNSEDSPTTNIGVAMKKGNPLKQTTNVQDLSKNWQKIVDFIFEADEGKFSEMISDNNKTLVAARFLKSIICIFLYMNCSLPSSENIQRFLNNFFKHLFDDERGIDLIIPTSIDIDLNNFRSYIMNPSPNEFYIDICKLGWYLNSEDDGLIDRVQALNECLYKVDCKTELISSVHSFIQTLLIIGQSAVTTDPKKQDIPYYQIDDNLLILINDALKINFLPITTVEEIFKLFQTIIMSTEKLDSKQQPQPQQQISPTKSQNTKNQGLIVSKPDAKTQDKNKQQQSETNQQDAQCIKFSDEKLMEVLISARDFLKDTPNSTVFKGITELLQLTDDSKKELLIGNRVLADLFIIACKNVETENPDENATSLVIEISYIVSYDPAILERENAIIYLSFFKAVINTKYAIHALKATRILCRQKHSVENLEKAGLFDYLISIIEPGQDEITKNSSLWPHIFSIFLSLLPESHITANFICKCFPFITFFLNENASRNDTQLLQTKESIVNLIAHVSKNISVLSSENPSTVRALTELIYIQLDIAFKKLINDSKTTGSLNYQNLSKIELHNAQTANILILHSCLTIFNNLVTHPFMKLPQGFQKEDSTQKIMNLLVGTIEGFISIIPIADKNNNEADPRLQFINIIYRSIEMAAQLFYGLAVSSKSESNQVKDEKQKIKDNANRYKKVIDEITNIVHGIKNEDAKLDIKFLNDIADNVIF